MLEGQYILSSFHGWLPLADVSAEPVWVFAIQGAPNGDHTVTKRLNVSL